MANLAIPYFAIAVDHRKMSNINNTASATETQIKAQAADLCYEDINDRFARGKLCGINVIIEKATGYINSPSLARDAFSYEVTRCKELGKEYKRKSPKRYDDWRSKNSETIEFLETISLHTRRRVGELFHVVTDADNELRGTYMYPLVAIEYARWLSPSFAVLASRIVLEYTARESREEKRLLLEELNKTKQEIKVKDDKIDQLRSDIQELKRLHYEQITELRATREDLAATNENNEYLADRVDCAIDRLTNIAPNVVIEQADPGKDELFVIMRNNDYDHEASKMRSKRNKREDFLYIAMCGTVEYIKSRKSFMRRKKGYVEVATITRNPNTKNLLNRVRQLLAESSKVIEVYCNWFNIIDPKVSESQLVEAIRDIDNDRYEIADLDADADRDSVNSDNDDVDDFATAVCARKSRGIAIVDEE